MVSLVDHQKITPPSSSANTASTMTIFTPAPDSRCGATGMTGSGTSYTPMGLPVPVPGGGGCSGGAAKAENGSGLGGPYRSADSGLGRSGSFGGVLIRFPQDFARA